MHRRIPTILMMLPEKYSTMKWKTLFQTVHTLTVLCGFLLILKPLSGQAACLKTALNMDCLKDSDCHIVQERHMYCNRRRVLEDWDCPSDEYSAYPGSNPVRSGITSGLDCMRLCYKTRTCFGAAVKEGMCYLKNDECFHSTSLEESRGTLLGVVRVFQEDYHCGCHYQFERLRKNGTVVKWNPPCPGSHLETSRYKCCSKKGLCELCA